MILPVPPGRLRAALQDNAKHLAGGLRGPAATIAFTRSGVDTVHWCEFVWVRPADGTAPVLDVTVPPVPSRFANPVNFAAYILRLRTGVHAYVSDTASGIIDPRTFEHCKYSSLELRGNAGAARDLLATLIKTGSIAIPPVFKHGLTSKSRTRGPLDNLLLLVAWACIASRPKPAAQAQPQTLVRTHHADNTSLASLGLEGATFHGDENNSAFVQQLTASLPPGLFK